MADPSDTHSDFGAGILFALAGLAGLILARGLTIGSIARMGPGFFPLIVSGGLIVIGGGLILRGLRRHSARQPFRWEATVWLLAAPAAFALLVERAGLVPAVAAASLAVSLALYRVDTGRQAGTALVEGLALAGVLSLGAALVFVLGLGLPLRLWP